MLQQTYLTKIICSSENCLLANCKPKLITNLFQFFVCSALVAPIHAKLVDGQAWRRLNKSIRNYLLNLPPEFIRLRTSVRTQTYRINEKLVIKQLETNNRSI